MTSLLSAKKRAEEFAAFVEGGADESTLRPELAELVGVVGTLQREAETRTRLAPRPDFTAELRERLMAEAETSFVQDNILALPVRKKSGRERRIALAASSLVLIGGTAGMAAAAQNALPGEALYPIKRGLEKAQTELATSRADQGEDLLAQADNRLVEVQGLFDGSSDLSQVPVTIDDFTRQAVEASDVLIQEFETSRDPALIEELRTFAADNLAELQELAKTAEPEHQDELALAADALMQIDTRAQAVCPTCATELRSLKMPALFLTANEARDAMDAMGRVLTDNSHPVITEEVEGKPGDGKDSSPEGKTGKDAPNGGKGEESPGDEGTGGSDGTDDIPGLPGSDVGTNAPDGDSDIVEDITGGKGDGSGGKGDGSKGDGGKSGAGGTTEDVLPDEVETVVDAVVP